MKSTTIGGVEVRGRIEHPFNDVLTAEALAFVASLHRRFDATRQTLLERRRSRQAELLLGGRLGFLPETRSVREGSWHVAPAPEDLQDRRVEITGPVERKMMINALNSGAKVFMADFEDANSPTWDNEVEGQLNLIDAVRRTIRLEAAEKTYELGRETATLMVRPRGWHLDEKHLAVDGRPVSASLVDSSLFVFHNGKELFAQGTGPYLYLPKMESHLEARLWNDVLAAMEETVGLRHGTIKVTVLIETIPAAFEMEEILHELRDRITGLNAGRWDYIFSIIKKFRDRPSCILPDRAQVTMTVPFMRAYTALLVRTCHRRGAHAIGGMAAFVPSRKDPSINEVAFARVREDKVREATEGFDGTWVAHPDLVPIAMQEFDRVLGSNPNQITRPLEARSITAEQLTDVQVPGGRVTELGLRNNVSVGLQYLESWLRGNGAAAIFNLMEDTATAEIARSQVWQWIRHGVHLQEGPTVTPELVRRIEDEELVKIRETVGPAAFKSSRFKDARAVFDAVSLGSEFVEFLTQPAYERLE